MIGGAGVGVAGGQGGRQPAATGATGGHEAGVILMGLYEGGGDNPANKNPCGEV